MPDYQSPIPSYEDWQRGLPVDLYVPVFAYNAAKQAGDKKLEELVEASVFLLSFVPAWAKEVPDGLSPMFYGTLTADGDREVKNRVDEIGALLAKYTGRNDA